MIHCLTLYYRHLILKITGVSASDGRDSRFTATSDLNGDSINEIIIGDYNNDTTATDAGMVSLGYPYIDVDGDGVPGESGLISRSDCNDNNAFVSAEQTFYIDNDGAGSIDEANNSTNPHPQYSPYDPADSSLYATAITSVVGVDNGKIKVTYADNSVYKYQIFNIATS